MDVKRLAEVSETDKGFQNLGRAGVDVLNIFVGAKLKMKKARGHGITVLKKRMEET